MAAKIVVFETEKERAMMCADHGHDWKNQEDIFGTETEKLLETCDKLFHASLRFQNKKAEKLLKKVFGIAKAHGVYITWYGMSKYANEPDRFLVSGRGYECLGFIQC